MNGQEDVIRAALAPARALELTPGELESVLERIDPQPAQRSARARRVLSFTALALILLTGTALAVPSVRAAAGDVLDQFGAYLFGASPDGPGRVLEPGDDPPSYVTDTAAGWTEPRLIASAGDYELFAVRSPSGSVTFALDDELGIGDSPEGWAEEFARHPIVILGPGASDGPDEHGVVPLYGLVSPGVEQVAVEYSEGPDTLAEAESGGFVALVEPEHEPLRVVATDAEGAVVASRPVEDLWK